MKLSLEYHHAVAASTPRPWKTPTTLAFPPFA